MAYSKTNWQDLPNQTTPINATNLNKIEQGIYDATYVNGVNVGSSVNSDYRVNFLHSRNLFDGIIEQGGFDNSGLPQDNATRVRSANFIAVKPNTTYTVTVPSNTKVIIDFYNTNTSSSTRIGQTDGWVNVQRTFTTPANTNYIKLLIGKQNDSNITPSEVSNVMLNIGSTALAYEPYIADSIIVDGDKFTETLGVGTNVDGRNKVNFLKSKNLLPNNISTQTINGVTITKNNDKSITLNGTANANITIYDYINIKLFTGTYTHSCQNNIPQGMYLSLNNINSTMIGTSGNTNKVTFTLSEDTDYDRYVLYIASGVTLNNLTIYPMIEKGSTATTYEPYVTPSINVDGETIANKNIYSSSEVVIGEWFGKPLYRQVLEASNPTHGGYPFGTLPISASQVKKIEAVCLISTGGMICMGYNGFFVQVDSANRLYYSNQNYTGTKLIVTIEYTKTTDTATRSLNAIEQTRSIPTESTQDDER